MQLMMTKPFRRTQLWCCLSYTVVSTWVQSRSSCHPASPWIQYRCLHRCL